MDRQLPSFFIRGPSLLYRLSFFALLSLALLIADARFHYLETLRQGVSVVIYPIQRLATAPGKIYARTASFFATQMQLAEENNVLKQETLAAGARAQRMEAVLAENNYLRSLLEARTRLGGSAIMAEILYAERDPFSRKIILDKGAQQGVKAGYPVIDDVGVVGQVTRIYPLVAEVTLLTDKDQAVPVELTRNGLRSIAFGVGENNEMELRFMPANADIQNGDKLVTSGIDGIYPHGLAVAVVSNIERNAALPFARITCAPIAGIDRHRQLLILAEPQELPAAPAAAEAQARKPRRPKKGD